MPQWRSKSLCILTISFLIPLIIFNYGALSLGSSSQIFPFSPNKDYSEISISNLSILSLPVTIESYPRSQNKSKITLICDSEIQFKNRDFSLSTDYNIFLANLCNSLVVQISNSNNGTGFWLRVQKPEFSLLLFFTHLIFLSIVSISFYVFYQHRKNLMSLRSVMIIQISVFLMLDPLHLFSNIFSFFNYLHIALFAFGWWFCSSELFVEFVPLIREQAGFFKKLLILPSIALFFSAYPFSGNPSGFRQIIVNFSFFLGLSLFLLSTIFIFKVGNTTGKFSLFIHFLGGSFLLSIAYYIRILQVNFGQFKFSFFARTLEISCLGVYSMFQTIFQAGESTFESEQHISSIRRNDEIDKLFDDIENE